MSHRLEHVVLGWQGVRQDGAAPHLLLVFGAVLGLHIPGRYRVFSFLPHIR